jgi:ferrous iron transport protein B
MTARGAGSACESCPAAAPEVAGLVRHGLDVQEGDRVVALAGNPNTGKSTVFNRLTGLRQHTGNWPGKTVSRAEGAFSYGDTRFRLVDLPGTYSLLSQSRDEEIARNFLLFGQPHVTVVVIDATCLERNLNLALQVLEITDRVVICLNLVDEARRRGLRVDVRRLAKDLGVPVVPAAARTGEGIDELIRTISGVASGAVRTAPRRFGAGSTELDRALAGLVSRVEETFPSLPNARWVAMRLLEGDRRIVGALREGELGGELSTNNESIPLSPHRLRGLLQAAREFRWEAGPRFHDSLMETLFAEAARIADRALSRPDGGPRFDLDRALDRLVTSRLTGFPMMLALLGGVMWITVAGANVPSSWLAHVFLDVGHPALKSFAEWIGAPWWLSGALVDGVYLSIGWVVSVMLPPMAIFFPLFTILEDFGYLPRVAFNLDHLFRRAGAHGKQALTMSMGFGCNAAGVIAARVIDSPRERLIAILTNNFALCNGRWPTQILVASIFLGALVPAHLSGLIASGAVVGVALLGIAITLLASWGLSRTILKGEVSTFSLELPPYRPPRLLQTLYTSLIDRTIFVLWRAVLFAAPAGLVIWTSANVPVGDTSLAGWLIDRLDPVGLFLGLNGVILLAYLVAIPANEIVIPTVLMLTVLTTGLAGVGEGAGVMFELESAPATERILRAGGWTTLTAVNLMLFSLLHNPCSTTIFTIWRETGSARWTWVSVLLPLGLGLIVCLGVAIAYRGLGLGA